MFAIECNSLNAFCQINQNNIYGLNDITFTFDMTRGDLLYEGSSVSLDFIRLESDDKNGLQIARVQLAGVHINQQPPHSWVCVVIMATCLRS